MNIAVEKKEKSSVILRAAKFIERVGNRFPHPLYLFIYLMFIVMGASAICAYFDVSVTYSAANNAGVIGEKTVSVVNMLSKVQLQSFLANVVNAYKANPALCAMLIIVMSISICEETGFFQAGLRKVLLGAPSAVVTYALAVVSVSANIASDAGMILAPTIGAVLFKALGRNPWIGIAVGYAGAAGGFTANILPCATDVVLSGITNGISSPLGYNVNPLSNWYFMIVATLTLALTITFIAETFLVKMAGDTKLKGDASELEAYQISDNESRGLKYAGIGALVFLVLLLIGSIPLNGFFRDNAGQLVPNSPLISGLVPVISLFFVIVGICYGKGSKKIEKSKDIPKIMEKGVINMAPLVLILFAVSLFTWLFNTSNLSTIISVGGQRFLNSLGFTGLPMLITFVLVITIINLFMYSGSAKWFVFAPIFVPMFAGLNIHPAITQLAYRIGDSVTNNLTPLNACLLVTIVLMQKYKIKESDDPGVGTMLAMQLPFSIGLVITLIIQLSIFMVFNIPIGPGM